VSRLQPALPDVGAAAHSPIAGERRSPVPAEVQDERALVPVGGVWRGLVCFRGRARIDGTVLGDVVATGRLTVGEAGAIHGRLVVDEVVVAGTIEGEITARQRIELSPTACVVGQLRAPRVAISEGSVLSGHCASGPTPSIQ